MDGQSQNVKNIIITAFIGFLGSALFWLLQTLVDLGAFLSSFSLLFSQRVASKFCWFIVCPQKVTYSYPSGGAWLLLVICLLLCVVCIFSIHTTMKEKKKWSISDVVILCVLVCFLVISMTVHIQSIYATNLYERYCMANFRIAEFSQEDAAKFQIRMSKVETVANIEAILSEMGDHVRNVLEKRDVQNTPDTISGGPEAETESGGGGDNN